MSDITSLLTSDNKPEVEIANRVAFLKEYLLKTGAKGFVLGISGGQDSALAGMLAQIAVNELRDEGNDVKFHAVLLPYHEQRDIDDAKFVANEFIKADNIHLVNIGNTVDAFVSSFEAGVGDVLPDFDKGNVKARVRMTTQYAIAGKYKLLVIGSDHSAENITGFYTKFGDGAADIMPLFGLSKRRGKRMLELLRAPDFVIMKTPTADLLDNAPTQADEVELGVSYEDIDNYIEGYEIPEQTFNKIRSLFDKSEHKRHLPVTIYDTWWKK